MRLHQVHLRLHVVLAMRVSPSPLVVPRASRPRLTRLPEGGFARISPKKEEEAAVEADAGDGLSAYELVRLRNIAERTRMMESLALVEGFRQLKQQGRRRNTIGGGGGIAKKTPAEFPRRLPVQDKTPGQEGVHAAATGQEECRPGDLLLLRILVFFLLFG